MASAFGTFGDSMKPKRSETRREALEIGVISHALVVGNARRIGDLTMVRTMLCSCSTLLCLRLCISEAGAKSGSAVRNTAVPETMCGGCFSRLLDQRVERHLDAARLLHEDTRAAPPA